VLGKALTIVMRSPQAKKTAPAKRKEAQEKGSLAQGEGPRGKIVRGARAGGARSVGHNLLKACVTYKTAETKKGTRR